MEKIVNFLNEVGMLSNTPRSGFAFLGSGSQSVAEHSYRVAMVGLALARAYDGAVNLERLLLICLSHDIPEARTGDMNYVNKKYVKVDETKALEELAQESFLGSEVASYVREYNAAETVEALLAKDADQLELLLFLKEEYDKGNCKAMDWFEAGVKRLKTLVGKEMAAAIKLTPSDQWWIKDKEDPHWIHGGKLSS